MFAKNSKAYSVYLLFRFVFSLAVSMSTVLSIVYHLEVVQLDAFQLVLVGTVLETSCFLFEIPTGVVADLYSRRRSVLIGMFLYGLGFLMEGALPWFAPVLLAQVVWGCGDTFITGALEAWIASEEEDKPIDKVFLRGSQMGQIGGVLGVDCLGGRGQTHRQGVPAGQSNGANRRRSGRGAGHTAGKHKPANACHLGGQFVLVVGAGVGSHHARNQLLPCY